MRHVLLGCVASVALGSFAASAADLPTRAAPSPLSSFLTPMPVANWTGLYGGVHLGGVGGTFTNNVPAVSGPIDDAGSVIGGAQVGYNWQINQIVFGVEADISGLSMRAETGPTSFEENVLITLRGRAGYAWDRYLAYVTLGIGFTHVDVTSATGSDDKFQAGVAVGAGIEAVLWSPQWTARAEYLYVSVPLDTYRPGLTRIDGGSDNHIGRLAVNYRIW